MCPIPRAPRTVDTHIINEGILISFFFSPLDIYAVLFLTAIMSVSVFLRACFWDLKGMGLRGGKKSPFHLNSKPLIFYGVHFLKIRSLR